MVTSRHRFQGRNSLSAAYRRGTVVRGQSLQLRVLKNQSASYRLAVVVSKKVHKSAVVRNRIRRRLYEIARLRLSETNRDDLIISVFDMRLATMPAADLQKTVVKLFERANLQLTDSAQRAIVEFEV
jgi:ribonuclease P protein component